MSQSMEAGPTWHFPAPGGDCPSCGFRKEEKISLGPDHAGPKDSRASICICFLSLNIGRAISASLYQPVGLFSKTRTICTHYGYLAIIEKYKEKMAFKT